jgi:hypothetical protein
VRDKDTTGGLQIVEAERKVRYTRDEGRENHLRDGQLSHGDGTGGEMKTKE